MSETQDQLFYWFKMGKYFFDKAAMRYIENDPDGYAIVVLYIKLLNYSLSTNGYIRKIGEMPTSIKMIALETNMSEEIVSKGLDLLEQVKLIQVENENEYYFPEMRKFTGSETKNASRKRLERERKAAIVEKMRQCHTEIDLDKETDIEKEAETELLENSKKKKWSIHNQLEKGGYQVELKDGKIFNVPPDFLSDLRMQTGYNDFLGNLDDVVKELRRDHIILENEEVLEKYIRNRIMTKNGKFC